MEKKNRRGLTEHGPSYVALTLSGPTVEGSWHRGRAFYTNTRCKSPAARCPGKGGEGLVAAQETNKRDYS